MEQLRQVGEALGGITALMAFHHELRVNPRQCRLLADACALAFDAVAAEVSAHLRLEDRWRPLEHPLRELHRAVRDAELYIRHCLLGGAGASWWARVAAATHGDECVEHHLHAILWCVAVVLEAIETAATETTASSCDDDLARSSRLMFARDYDKELLDPALFRRSRVGKAYMATKDLAARMDMAWKEDRWLLSQLLDEMKHGSSASSSSSKPLSRHEHRLADLLAAPHGKLHPASVLAHDFHVRRRLGGCLKEAHWMGEPFAVKHYVGIDADAADAEAGTLMAAAAHPNVAGCRFCFQDEEKRELFVVMDDQLMTKDLGSYVKEQVSKRRATPMPLVVVVDAMLQIARGMEHLHAKKIFHGELSPANVLVKPRHGNSADAGYLLVKVAGFNREPAVPASPTRKTSAPANNANANASVNPCIWYAPEVLEQETEKRTEKADVYSFAMICFELITGKIPFEDHHLQGEHMSKNIRAGERPLFPFNSHKQLTGLTRRCWQADPAQRPAFGSICRVLRYVKRFLVMNPQPDQQQQPDSPTMPMPMPAVDYLDIEALLLRKFPAWEGAAPRVADVPFQMYAYRVMEKDRSSSKTTPTMAASAAAMLHIGKMDRSSDSGSDGNSLCGDESVHSAPDGVVEAGSMTSSRATTTPRSLSGRSSGSSRMAAVSTSSTTSPPRRPAARVAFSKGGSPQKSKSMVIRAPAQPSTPRRTPRIKSDGQLQAALIPPSRRRVSSGHASDSELA
ncbi:hypothetical protein BRADI_2g14850v3 [Brachypodium distachyon]|uniref:Protein kinase domain-containing protein n=1 Tax=Brachypodium distachyon TaxID=15368 RepID=A0A0Q3FZ30_BRADI|nr:hypothetical protein BRADI_2g14850v3 [Brachypodium distachyon]